MRRAANLDGNHKVVREALERIGCSVQSLASMGGGVPDLIVGYHGVNIFLEVKDGEKNAARREMTQAEKDWHAKWAGQRAVVESAEEAQLVVIDCAMGRDRTK